MVKLRRSTSAGKATNGVSLFARVSFPPLISTIMTKWVVFIDNPFQRHITVHIH